MPRQIEFECDAVKARYTLLEDLAPKTTAALWAHLPVTTRIHHGRISGDCAIVGVRGDQVKTLETAPTRLEAAVTSIYKGFIVGAIYPKIGLLDLTISYGRSELRRDNGRIYGTPVAEIEGDGSAWFELLKKLRATGEKQVTVRRVE